MLLVDELTPEIPAPAPEPGVTAGTSGGPPMGGGDREGLASGETGGQVKTGAGALVTDIKSEKSFWSWFLGLFA